MRLKHTFESVDMGDEIILVPVGESAAVVHGVLKTNSEAKEIIDALQTDITEEQLNQVFSEKYENAPEEIARYISKTIHVLQDAELIES